jgi:predicted PurR-regulated permease PerM
MGRTYSRLGWRNVRGLAFNVTTASSDVTARRRGAGTDCLVHAGGRQSREAAAVQSADIFSGLFAGSGRLGCRLRGKLDHTTVALAFVLQLILQPAVHFLERVRLPRAVGALLTILLVIGAIVGFVAALSVPAATWAEKLPEGIPRLEAHMVVLKRPIEALQKVIQQAEHVADAPGKKDSTVSVRRDLGITGILFAGTRAVLDGLFTTVLVLYFLLVSGEIFLRRIVEVLPNFADKRQAVDISQQIEADISAYLVTITAMNAAVGGATALAMYLCGLGDPLLWGATAFLLNYVPILGPLFGTVIFLLAGMLSFDSLWFALLPPALYFGIHLVEGETLTPMLLARRFTLNPVLVILSLVFWFWMWGVPGAILAVPMLAILKIVSDRVRPLKALGHVLEG